MNEAQAVALVTGGLFLLGCLCGFLFEACVQEHVFCKDEIRFVNAESKTLACHHTNHKMTIEEQTGRTKVTCTCHR